MKVNEKKHFAPIAIFTYKRLDTLKKAMESLKKCDYASESELYVFSDGPKKEEDVEQIQKVRNYINTISGFKKISTKFSEKNKGLANSVIGGTTEIVNSHGSVIVLEDDLVVSSNFLVYMNLALTYYESHDKVFSISGYTTPIKVPKEYEYDNYFTLRGSSWGWATWQNRWNTIDWELLDYEEFLKDKKRQKQFNRMGSDMCKMLNDQYVGKIDSWAVRWMYHQFKVNQYTVYPLVSKITNVGFGGEATHTNAVMDERFKTPMDNSKKNHFNFSSNITLDDRFIEQFIKTFSIKTRIYYKLRQLLKV